jgi:hypothetical protein
MAAITAPTLDINLAKGTVMSSKTMREIAQAYVGATDDEVAQWEQNSADYLTMRDNADTPEGEAYARRLEAMPLAEAAAELDRLFCLCADEDLAAEINCDLDLAPGKANARSRRGSK